MEEHGNTALCQSLGHKGVGDNRISLCMNVCDKDLLCRLMTTQCRPDLTLAVTFLLLLATTYMLLLATRRDMQEEQHGLNLNPW